MKIGDKIRQVRNLKGLTQEEMAEKLEISINAYGRIERNETDINFSRLEQISEAMKISILDLLSVGEQVLNYFNGSGNKGIGILHGNAFGSLHLEHELEKANMRIKALEKECELKDALIELLKS